MPSPQRIPPYIAVEAGAAATELQNVAQALVSEAYSTDVKEAILEDAGRAPPTQEWPGALARDAVILAAAEVSGEVVQTLGDEASTADTGALVEGSGAIAAAPAIGATLVEADVAGAEVQVTVVTLGGEVALDRCSAPPSTTVADLLRQLHREGGPPELLKLLLGSRQLAAHEVLGDLEVRDAEEGLVLVLVRHAADKALVRRFKRSIFRGALWVAENELVGGAAVDAVAYLLLDPTVALRELRVRQPKVAEDITPIAEALRVNTSLRLLFLAGTEVRSMGGLAAALRANRGLQRVVLQSCQLCEDEKEELRAVEREKGELFTILVL